MTSFLTTNALANHQVGLIVCRALQTLGPKSDNDLRGMLIPNYSVQPPEKVDQWDDTLAALKRSEIISEVNGNLNLCSQLQNCGEITHEDFAIEFMRGLTKANLESIGEGQDPDDLFLGIVWLLTLPNGYLVRKFDPNGQDLNGAYRRLQNFGFTEAVVNSEQWRAFRRWARGLGLMRQLDGNTDSVDISDFVLSYLTKMNVNSPINEFLLQIGEFLPFLGSTELDNWYAESTGLQPGFSVIEDQLGWALFRAEQRSVIELINEDDTRVNTIALPISVDGPERLVTHIRKVA
jgi:hypothetical protein